MPPEQTRIFLFFIFVLRILRKSICSGSEGRDGTSEVPKRRALGSDFERLAMRASGKSGLPRKEEPLDEVYDLSLERRARSAIIPGWFVSGA